MQKKRILTSMFSVFMSLAMTVPAFAVPASAATARTVDPTDLIKTSTFDDGKGLPWTEVETPPSHAECDISDAKYNITLTNVPDTSNRWDIQFRHRGLNITDKHVYTIKFTVKATHDCTIYPKLGEMGGNYLEFWNYGSTNVKTVTDPKGNVYTDALSDPRGWKSLALKAGVATTISQTFQVDFSDSQCKEKEPKLVAGGSIPTCELAFHIGGLGAGKDGGQMGGVPDAGALPYTVSFSDIHLNDKMFTGYPPDPDQPSNAIRVNQVGYYPTLEKTATLVTPSTTAVPWQLHDSTGAVVLNGNSKLYTDKITGTSVDKASGDKVQIIDFSSYQKVGKGYYLTVDSKYLDPKLVSSPAISGATVAKSMTFNIGNDIYSTLKNDAINYFYQNRSGCDITLPYCVRKDLARTEGISDTALTNNPKSGYTGDSETYNVEKGWFDAGDHGKYVVNGGISVWTLMNQYERALNSTDKTLVTKAPYADGTMNIPENNNKYPDILDETRWEMDFMLGMQIQSGSLAGMAHHSAHDVAWTALCTRPDEDVKDRYVYPPSTAATLNLAASAAQASRLWKTYDAAYATKCLTAAKDAWTAAKANPSMYFATGGTGGGDYGDEDASDEFYWAACELYATTGDVTYLNEIKKSAKYLTMPSTLVGGEDLGISGSFDWGNVAGLGTISLVTAPNGLTATDKATAKANIAKAADAFINTENTQGYGSAIYEAPLTISTTKEVITGYPWGSNSFVENEAIVMGYAYDYTKDIKYVNGIATAMDYLLGRNPNVQSYITGYGTNALKNPHHRFWSYEEDNKYPKAPNGCISGGPNSGLEDPWVFGMGWKAGGYPGEKCFTDNIESWSTNEITINWNAPLSWITSYMDYVDKGYINYGDVNGDGKVNVIDYLKLKNYLNKKVTLSASNMKAADTNGDGAVTNADYVVLRNYLIGKVKTLPSK